VAETSGLLNRRTGRNPVPRVRIPPSPPSTSLRCASRTRPSAETSMAFLSIPRGTLPLGLPSPTTFSRVGIRGDRFDDRGAQHRPPSVSSPSECLLTAHRSERHREGGIRCASRTRPSAETSMAFLSIPRGTLPHTSLALRGSASRTALALAARASTLWLLG
jgi:hypothetical protein